MTATPGRKRPAHNLDNLSLARKEGWRDFVEAPRRERPESLTVRQIRRLNEPARAIYNTRRRTWHANMGTIKTPELIALHEQLEVILDSNVQDGDKAKGAIAVDGNPYVGKTTASLASAKLFHQREIAAHGPYTRAGHERWPVCRIGLQGNTSLKDFNRALCDFFAHPGAVRGSASQFANRALDLMLSCEVRLLIIDDLHFLHWQHRGGVEIGNQFKYVANDFPVTLLLIGVGLKARDVLGEGDIDKDTIFTQTPRHTTILEMQPFSISTERARRQWRDILVAIERRIILGRKQTGMLADELSDYLFARSGGYIGSLMTLINRGCTRAIRTGAETLDKPLLDHITIDSAAERARSELESAFRTRRLRSNPSL
jgi:hypothetical protein